MSGTLFRRLHFPHRFKIFKTVIFVNHFVVDHPHPTPPPTPSPPPPLIWIALVWSAHLVFIVVMNIRKAYQYNGSIMAELNLKHCVIFILMAFDFLVIMRWTGLPLNPGLLVVFGNQSWLLVQSVNNVYYSFTSALEEAIFQHDCIISAVQRKFPHTKT